MRSTVMKSCSGTTRNDSDLGHTWLRSLFIDTARDLQA